jgi:hypothetical protein
VPLGLNKEPLGLSAGLFETFLRNVWGWPFGR